MRSHPLVLFGFVIVAFLAVFAFVTVGRDAELRRVCSGYCALQPNYAARDRLAPDFELAKLGGGSVKLSALRGKIVVLHFWTKNCPPCLEELPGFSDWAKVVKRRFSDVEVLALNTDETDQIAADTLKAALVGETPGFTVLRDPDGRVVTGKYGTKLYPETWLIDRDGLIRVRVDGARSWKTAVPLSVVESLRGPTTCQLRFERGHPVGAALELCGDG